MGNLIFYYTVSVLVVFSSLLVLGVLSWTSRRHDRRIKELEDSARLFHERTNTLFDRYCELRERMDRVGRNVSYPAEVTTGAFRSTRANINDDGNPF